MPCFQRTKIQDRKAESLSKARHFSRARLGNGVLLEDKALLLKLLVESKSADSLLNRGPAFSVDRSGI